ncbi:peptidase A1 domain-containing protein [Citrus sinensis]|uniref:Peptidase A1 domain-containing protein n=1 Tax=Citrus sinensis TaxID=2711 RepID=A0ACB8P894_CITSI|nr:peptidase A1 domain-containing protein [Citrus sinensis]
MDGSYYVTLEGISLGEKMPDIDPNFFKKNDTGSDDGVFVNSGTTITWLVPSAYQTLRKEIEQLPEGRAVVEIPNGAGVASLLLRGHQSRSSRFSSDSISFCWWPGGADLAFPFASPRTVCLYRFLPRHNDLSIIGHCSSAEPNNVAHDLVNKQLYFHIIDSELLDG